MMAAGPSDILVDLRRLIDKKLTELGDRAMDAEARTDELACQVRRLARNWLNFQPAIVALLPRDEDALKAFLFPGRAKGGVMQNLENVPMALHSYAHCPGIVTSKEDGTLVCAECGKTLGRVEPDLLSQILQQLSVKV